MLLKLTSVVKFNNISRTAFSSISLAEKNKHKLLAQKSFEKRIFVQKAACKIMVKLTTAVNFINIIRTNFSYKRPFLAAFLVTF